ncbi:hypothetical protein D3C87_991230 [compost metagenome]
MAAETQPVPFDDAGGFGKPDTVHLLAPGRDGGDAVRKAGIDNSAEIATLPHGGEIDGKAFKAHVGISPHSVSADTPDGEKRVHALRRQIRLCKHIGLVRQPEKLGEMLRGAGAFLAANHGEMVL